MANHIRNGAGALSVLALALLLTAAPAWAEMEVMESNAPGIKAGDTLKDDASLKIPGGSTVRLLLGTGGTKTLKGPYEGTVAGYKSDGGWLKKFTDPNKDEAPPAGITRGIKKPE